MGSTIERRISTSGKPETNPTIERRMFVVGCPRSGTSLLHGLLGNHPRCITIPETSFFTLAVPTRIPLRRKLGLASQSANQAFDYLVKLIGDPQMERFRPSSTLFFRPYADAFVQVMDTYALQQGKTMWVEKTPSHLNRIAEIEKYVPKPLFIHLIRNGVDVVASLYDATKRYPDIGWGGEKSIDECIDQWIQDIHKSARYQNKPGHFFIRYEYLTEQPQIALQEICEFLKIDFDATIMQRREEEARKMAQEGKLVGYHELLTAPIQNANGRKRSTVFTPEQSEYVAKRVAEIKLEELITTAYTRRSEQNVLTEALVDAQLLTATAQMKSSEQAHGELSNTSFEPRRS